MKQSLITQKVIAHSLKKLMNEMPFQKITISHIMKEAGMRRQTFYDYFQDKYDLLTWIYQQETKENIQDYLDYEHWSKSITRLLHYFKENKTFYQNALKLNEQNSFDHYFLLHIEKLIHIIMDDLRKHDKQPFNEHEMNFFAVFYAHAFVGVVREWLMDDCTVAVKKLSKDIQTQFKRAFSS